MGFCRKCGTQLREDDKFCNQCGEPTGEIQNSIKEEPKEEGSFGAGFLLSIWLGFLGFIIAFAIDKERTKSGAKAGIVLYIIILLISFMVLKDKI